MRHVRIPVTLCLWAVLLSASTTSALDIRVSFDDDNSLPEDFPSFDPDASLLAGIVEYAATVYEDIIEDDHVLDITYRWDRDLDEKDVRTGLHNLLDQSDGRETSARIRFDPDPDWFIDPTPMTDSEFDMAPVFFRDLSSTSPSPQSQRERRFSGDVPDLFEAGYRGEAHSNAPTDAQNGFDLLTIVFHEMGHALGMSGFLTSALDETEDGDYDIDPGFVGGNVMAEKVRNTDTTNNRAHLFGGGNQVDFGDVPGPAVMTFVGDGERRRPSAADILAMSAPSNWTDLDLPRKYFLDGNSWRIGLNWLGGSPPDMGDEVFLLHGGSVGLDGTGHALNLLIDEDSRLTVRGTLRVGDTATVGSGELFVNGSDGPTSDAGATVDAQLVVVDPTGTLRMIGDSASGEEAVVMGGDVVLAGGRIHVSNQGRIDSTTRIFFNSNVFTNSGGMLNLNGDLTGSADLIKTGTGTLVINGENEGWSGDLIIDNGRVNIAPGNSLGNSTTVNLRSAPGFIDFSPAGHVQVFGGLQGDGTVLLGSHDIWFGANNTDTVFTGPIIPPLSGVRSGFVKLGTGTTTFADDALALDVGRASSREGGTLVFSGTTFVSTALLEATTGSTVRIEGDAHVVAFASDFSSGLFELFGGTFESTGFDGVLLNEGSTLSPGMPGDNTRVLSISDNFNNSADSTLQIDIGGLTPGEHDQLSLLIGPPGTGKFAGLGGTLDINLVDGFLPDLGDTFTIVKARSVSFSGVLDAPIFNGMTFDVMVVNVGPNEMHAVLQVIEAPLLAGDYNRDGIVDAADYTTWRDNLGSTFDQDDYDVWKNNFGATLGSGAGNTALVPEPTIAPFILLASAGFAIAYRRPRSCEKSSRSA